MPRKPNIVFIFNDHQAYYRHGWDSGPKIMRPHFERLVSEGISFNRSYTASPLCCPARRTILTGLFPHNHGEIQNGVNHPFDRETYYAKLAEEGYKNFYYGKWHAGPGTAHDHYCEGFSYPSYNNPYTKPEYKEYLRKKSLPEPEIIIERCFWKRDIKKGDRYIQDKDWCNEHMSGIMQTPAETHEAFFLANLVCDKLKEFASSNSNQPFSLRVDFWGPHQPYFPTKEFASLYNPADIPMYGNFLDNLSNKPEIYKRECNVPMSNGDWETGRIIFPNPLPWHEWQKTLALCYAQITMVDAAGGMILDALDKYGLVDNTIVIWTTDHGDGIACHGGHFDKRAYMPEEMVRVPLAIRYPNVIKSGQVSDALVSNIDIAPTILEAAGSQFSDNIDGTSLFPLFRDTNAKWRDDLMCETHGHGQKHIGRLVVAGKYKYVANQNDMNELYNLENDRYELTNLIDSKKHRAVIEEMKQRLIKWQSKTNDEEIL